MALIFTLRKILFYVFVVLYLVLCPLLILHALGMSFDLSTKKIIRTGLISLETVPPGARIYIHNRRFPKKTPTIIRNLPPGEHPITLSLQGHFPWEGMLSVEADRATDPGRILLIPERWPIQTLASLHFENITHWNHPDLILAQQGLQLNQIFLYQFKDSSSHFSLLSAHNSVYASMTIKKIFSQKDSPVVILNGELNGHAKFLWMNLAQNPLIPQDITELFTKTPEKILWDSQYPEIIFTLQKGAISQLNANSRTIYPNIITDVHDFDIHNQQIYVLTNKFLIERYDLKSEKEKSLLNSPQLAESLFNKHSRWEMFVLSDDLVIFLSDAGTLLANHLPYEFVEKNVRGFRFQTSQNRLLIFTDDKMGVLDFNSPQISTSLFETPPQLTWLNIPQSDIKDVSWVDDESYIIYATRHEVFLLDMQMPASLKPYKITDIPKGTRVAYLQGNLIYLAPSTKHLSAIPILSPEFSLLKLPRVRGKWHAI